MRGFTLGQGAGAGAGRSAERAGPAGWTGEMIWVCRPGRPEGGRAGGQRGHRAGLPPAAAAMEPGENHQGQNGVLNTEQISGRTDERSSTEAADGFWGICSLIGREFCTGAKKVRFYTGLTA